MTPSTDHPDGTEKTRCSSDSASSSSGRRACCNTAEAIVCFSRDDRGKIPVQVVQQIYVPVPHPSVQKEEVPRGMTQEVLVPCCRSPRAGRGRARRVPTPRTEHPDSTEDVGGSSKSVSWKSGRRARYDAETTREGGEHRIGSRARERRMVMS